MRNKLALLLILLNCIAINNIIAQNNRNKPEETIFVFGGDINLKFVRYVAELTNKQDPKICYLPTASADNENNIKYWGNICKSIGIEPIVLKIWVSSSPLNKSFEEIILNMDAIVVGGGNTLNMLGIWKAQGIDKILEKALKSGIILSGGSAGSICWFQNGISDSRPVNLSSVDGLGYLSYSNCPHYSNESRKELYHQLIIDKKIPFGYACDDLAGILFKNGKPVEFVSQSDKHNSYFVQTLKGTLEAKKIDSKILINKNSIPATDLNMIIVKQKIKDLLDSTNKNLTPKDAYISTIKENRLSKTDLNEKDRIKILNTAIEEIFIYNNTLAGVVNDAYDDFYGMWYFYNCNGSWESAGEDIGGETLFECEITFREKAKVIIEKAQKQLNCH